MTRQRRWQLKQRALGLCVLCNLPTFKAHRCRLHYHRHLERIRRRLRGYRDPVAEIAVVDGDTPSHGSA